MSKVATTSYNKRKIIYAIAGIITVSAGIFATQLSTAMDFENFLPKDIESVETSQRIDEYFGGQEIDFILVEDNVTSPETIQRIYQLEQAIKNDSDHDGLIDSTFGLPDLFLITQGSLPNSEAEVNYLLDQIETNDSYIQYRDQVSSIINENRTKTLILITSQASSDKDLKKIAKVMRENRDEITENATGEYKVGGSAPIVTDIMANIVSTQLKTTAAALILCAIMLMIIFRSPIVGLLALLPVSLTILWEWGTLYALGLSLDVIIVMISSLVVGMGIDFSIHVTHRYMHEWKTNKKDPEKSLKIAVRNVGRALLAGAITTGGVFLVIALSRMRIMQNFGIITAIVIFYAMFAALLILPPLLVGYAKMQEKKKSKQKNTQTQEN